MIQKNWVNGDLVNRFGAKVKLEEMISSLETEYEKDGHVICSVEINGLALSEEDEKRLAQTSVEEIKTLNIFLSKPSILVGSVLQDWVEILPSLINQGDQLSELIRFDGLEGNYKNFSEFIDTCQLLVSSLEQIRPFLEVFRSKDLDFISWKKNEVDFAKITRDILVVFQKNDFVQLADLIEYDLNNTLQLWQEHLVEVKKLVEKENIDIK